MGLTLSMRLTQAPLLQQQIELGVVLTYTPAAIAKAIDKIQKDPAGAEKIIHDVASHSKTNHVQSTAPELCNRAGDPKKRYEGLITPLSMKELFRFAEVNEKDVTPDLLFKPSQNENEAPGIFYSESFLPKPGLKLLDPEYEAAAKLMKKLVSFRDWSTRTAREAYESIRDKQRKLINTGRLIDAVPLSRQSLADILDLHETTVGRLMNPRYVEIGYASGNLVVPVNALLPTNDDVAKYLWKNRINEHLAEEFKEKTAYSDDKIAAGKINGVRRTITKYRIEEGIPAVHERQKQYDSGLAKPYAINLTLANPPKTGLS